MKSFILILLIITTVQLHAQIKGRFSGHAKQPVSLSAYNGFERQQLAETIADSLGNFNLALPSNYQGVAFLQFNKADGIELIVTQTTSITINGTNISDINTLSCENNTETNALYTYYKQQIAREKALAGWKYLSKAYNEDVYLKKFASTTDIVNKEIHLLEKESSDFIAAQAPGSYMEWYLPLISFVRDIPVSVQRYPERIPAHISRFMHTNFSDQHFYHSGMLPVLLENYYFMLENMSSPPDSVYAKMNKSTDYIINKLKDGNQQQLQDACLFLLNLFEKRSLYQAAEHLSLSMLQQKTISLNNDIKNRVEGYRTMKRGNRAPDIDFTKAIMAQKDKKDELLNKYMKGHTFLSGIESKYKLVVFGQGECPNCHAQMQKISQMYSFLQANNTEVIYISLDTEKSNFVPVASEYPWVSYFDYAGWNSKPVLDYHVFASPTMYLLNNELEILHKVISPEHLEAIVNNLNRNETSKKHP